MSDKTPIKTLNGHPLVDETARQGVEDLAAKVAEIEESGVAGEDGGYYQPSVAATGLLSWTGSKSGMPRVEAVNVMGPRGPAGETGPAGDPGPAGPAGRDGVGIKNMAQTTTSSADGGANVWTAQLTDGSTKTFTVKNGSQGPAGADGADGKTPVKGTDYWTDADKAEMVVELCDTSPVVRYDTYQMLTTQQAEMARSNVGIGIGVNVPSARNPAGWSANVSSYAADAVVCHNGKLYIRQDYWDGELNPEPGTDALSWAEFVTDSSEVGSDITSIIVNFTYGDDGETLVADKTFTELYAAFTAGAMLFANVEAFIYPLIEGWAGGLTFGAFTRLSSGFRYFKVELGNDDAVSTNTVQIPIRDILFGGGYGGNRLLYFDENGNTKPLILGTGLKIENGVLMLDGTVTPDTPDTPSKTAICGTVLAGEVLCGEGV